MQITVDIVLNAEEYASDLSGNATELALKILRGVGGDSEEDFCSVNIRDAGQVGQSMMPPLAVSPPPPEPAP